MTDLIYNHISARLPGPEHRFLLNPFGLLYEEVTASNLVIVGLDGELVTDGPWKVNPAGFVIHSAIHAAREDALCVLHTHTKAGCAVAAQEHGLLPLNQMSLEFYNRVAYHDYEGIALSNAEKSRLVADLGAKPVMILRNHGLLTVGKTPGEAFLRMFYLERACEIQVDALAGGAPIVIPPPEVCEHTARQFEGARSNDDYSNDAPPTSPGTPCSAWSSACTRTTRTERDRRANRAAAGSSSSPGRGDEEILPRFRAAFTRALEPEPGRPGRLRRQRRPRGPGRPRRRRPRDLAAARVTAAHVAALPGLRVVAAAATGYDHLTSPPSPRPARGRARPRLLRRRGGRPRDRDDRRAAAQPARRRPLRQRAAAGPPGRSAPSGSPARSSASSASAAPAPWSRGAPPRSACGCSPGPRAPRRPGAGARRHPVGRWPSCWPPATWCRCTFRLPRTPRT